MGFPRQEYWSGLPFPPPGHLRNPGIKPTSPALAGGLFITEPLGNHGNKHVSIIITLNINGLNSPIKRHRVVEWIQKQDPCTHYLQEIHCSCKDTQTESEGI